MGILNQAEKANHQVVYCPSQLGIDTLSAKEFCMCLISVQMFHLNNNEKTLYFMLRSPADILHVLCSMCTIKYSLQCARHQLRVTAQLELRGDNIFGRDQELLQASGLMLHSLAGAYHGSCFPLLPRRQTKCVHVWEKQEVVVWTKMRKVPGSHPEDVPKTNVYTPRLFPVYITAFVLTQKQKESRLLWQWQVKATLPLHHCLLYDCLWKLISQDWNINLFSSVRQQTESSIILDLSPARTCCGLWSSVCGRATVAYSQTGWQQVDPWCHIFTLNNWSNTL